MNPPEIERQRPGSAPSTPDNGPQLLLDWSSPRAEFAGNLVALLSRRTRSEIVPGSVPDYGFWSGTDLRTPFPLRGAAASLAAHAALLGLLYAVSLAPRDSVHLVESSVLRAFGGVRISLYLPELHGAHTARKTVGKADPAPGLQAIHSLPDEPDNLRQTIVAPPQVKLRQDVALPNLAAMDPAPAIQPLESSAKAASLRLPMMVPEVVRPAPEVTKTTDRRHLPALLPEVVQPTVDARGVRARGRLPNFVPQVVEPAPETNRAEAKLYLPNFVPSVVQPTPDVNSLARGGQGKLAQMLNRGADPVPPSPAVNSAQHGGGAVLALNLNPADIHQPLSAPQGNRRGEFATSPTGRPGATGTPGAGEAAGRGAAAEQPRLNAPPGIDVSAPPRPPSASAALPGAPSVGTTAAPATAPLPDAELKSRLMAAMRAPAPHNNIPARPATENNAPGSQLETRIFNGRRSYTLAVNMPNLNATTGSWIIHFVEHNPEVKSSAIAAPEVIRKSDPAYPGDLINNGVQGTVILTAVIRADGSVGDIAVAKSLEPRLDHNAAEAFAHWLFHPAMKDGHAIDLDAVILVPYRVHSTKF